MKAVFICAAKQVVSWSNGGEEHREVSCDINRAAAAFLRKVLSVDKSAEDSNELDNGNDL